MLGNSPAIGGQNTEGIGAGLVLQIVLGQVSAPQAHRRAVVPESLGDRGGLVVQVGVVQDLLVEVAARRDDAELQ